MYDNRNYLIFTVTEIDKIDFSQVCETSPETLRRSTDGTKSFIKWDGDQPVFVADLETAEGPYSHSEILEILSGPEWTKSIEESV